MRTASPVARTALELADRVVTKRNLNEKSELRLARAALAWTPAEWLLLQAGACLGAALAAGPARVAPPARRRWSGTVAGVFVPRAYLSCRGGRRQKAFEDKLPDALQMVGRKPVRRVLARSVAGRAGA